MRHVHAWPALFLSTLVGCHAMTSRADPDWKVDLKRADAIVVRNPTAEQRVTDPEVVARLARIYEEARWEPYWHTLPAYLNDRSIDVYQGDAKLRHFCYTGVLWEYQGYDSNRVASLPESDRDWLESLFESVPDEVAR